MKKIALLSLALVMALGTLGVAYAMWYDTVTISGNVQTGTVDIEFLSQSYDRVYKNLTTDVLVYEHIVTAPGAPAPAYLPYPPNLLVGETTAMVTGPNTMVISYNNIFPIPGSGWNGAGYWFTDFLLHNNGSVPVKLEVDLVVSPSLAGLTVVAITDTPTSFPPGAPLEGIQLDPFQSISTGIGVFIPDDNAYQNLVGNITLTIHGVQWNEYSPGPPP